MRKPIRSLIVALAILPALVLTACGSSTAKTDGSSVVETSVVETSVAVETSAAAEAPEETTPVATSAVEVPVETTAAAAAETTAAEAGATTTLGVGGAASGDAVITQLISTLNGGTPPDPSEVSCVSGKVTPEDITAMAAGDSTNTAAFEKVFGALFTCNPKGLSDNFAAQTFSETKDITAEQKSCLGDKLVKIIAGSSEIVKAIAANADKPPAEFMEKGEDAIKDCVPAGPVRDSLLKELASS